MDLDMVRVRLYIRDEGLQLWDGTPIADDFWDWPFTVIECFRTHDKAEAFHAWYSMDINRHAVLT